MYNRYVPQGDGTYRRNRMEDPGQIKPAMQAREEAPVPPQQSCEQELPPCRKGQPCAQYRPQKAAPPRAHPQAAPVGSFLRQLLPRDFDTEDLLVVILLLLMAGDSREDQNFALLTLAIYLFL